MQMACQKEKFAFFEQKMRKNKKNVAFYCDILFKIKHSSVYCGNVVPPNSWQDLP